MGLLGTRTEKAKKRAKDFTDFDLDVNLPKMKDIHVPHRHEEPESSTAGFIAGVAVGVLLGVVLSYLFGKGGGSDMADQFAHRAGDLKDSATDKLQQVRDRAEGAAGESVDKVADSAKSTVDEAKDTA